MGMNIVKTTLKARTTQDGVDFIKDEVPLGKQYWIDLDSVRQGVWLNTDRNIEVTRPMAMVFAKEDGSDAGWMPLELFITEDAA